MPGNVGERFQALALLEEGVSVQRIIELTGLSKTTTYRLKRNAVLHGYAPSESRVLKAKYVDDGHCSGRPRKAPNEKADELENAIQKDRAGRNATQEKWMGSHI
ncbi:MAG: hypothetical protein M4579_007553, partial [Chaenotheca gracillima]